MITKDLTYAPKKIQDLAATINKYADKGGVSITYDYMKDILDQESVNFLHSSGFNMLVGLFLPTRFESHVKNLSDYLGCELKYTGHSYSVILPKKDPTAAISRHEHNHNITDMLFMTDRL